jgi:PKD domain
MSPARRWPSRAHRRVALTLAAVVFGSCWMALPVSSGVADQGAAIIMVTRQPEDGSAPTQVAIAAAQVASEGHVSNHYITVTGSVGAGASLYHSGLYSGMSMADLAIAAGIAPADVDGAIISDDTTGTKYPTVKLTADEVLNGFTADPNPADTSPYYAVVTGGDSAFTLVFVPPMAGPGQSNSSQIVQTTFGEKSSSQLDVTFQVKGDILTVNPPDTSPDPADIALNDSVAFSQPSVLLPNGQSDQNPDLAYSWNFEDGGPGATGPSPVRQYTMAGTWDATVTVTDAAADASGTAEVPVSVQQTRGNQTNPPNPPDPNSQGLGGGDGSASLGTEGALTGGGTAPKNALANGAAAPKRKKSASSAPPPNSVSDTRTGGPSGTSSRASGGGSGGASGGSGDARGGAAGGRGSGRGVDGGHGRQTTGSTAGGSQSAARRTAAAKRPAGSVNGLVGYVINSTGQAIPISLASSSVTSPRSLAAARASVGSGSSASRLGWIEGGAALLIVVSLGAWLEARPEHGVKTAVPAS